MIFFLVFFLYNTFVNEETLITFDPIISTQCSYSHSNLFLKVCEAENARSGAWTTLGLRLSHTWPHHPPGHTWPHHSPGHT